MTMNDEEKREKARQATRRYREKYPERIKETRRKHYEANREKILADSRERRANNKEKSREQARNWYAKNKQRVRERLRFVKYGISADEIQAMIESQNGNCAACGRPFSVLYSKERIANGNTGGRSPEEPDVDHNHETGIVRGILCRGCNLAIGNAEDSPERLRKMAEYLERVNCEVNK